MRSIRWRPQRMAWIAWQRMTRTPNSSRPRTQQARGVGLVAKPDAASSGPLMKTSVLLLDLSGNKEEATAWANAQLPGLNIRPISKVDLKWGSKRAALQRVRSFAPHTFAIFTTDLDMQSARGALMVLAVLAGSRRVVFGDSTGRAISRSRFSVLFIEAPLFSLE